LLTDRKMTRPINLGTQNSEAGSFGGRTDRLGGLRGSLVVPKTSNSPRQ